jgi:hypothetical protein
MNVQDLVRVHTEDGYTDVGRVVWIQKSRSINDATNGDDRSYWYIEFPVPHTPKGRSSPRKRFYIKLPVVASLAQADASMRQGLVTFVKSEPRSELLLTDEQLSAKVSSAGLPRPSRRDLTKWKLYRDAALAAIEPILNKYSAEDLFEGGKLRATAIDRSKQIARNARRVATKITAQQDTKDTGVSQGKSLPKFSRVLSEKGLEQLVLRFFLYGATPNALLPHWFDSGAPGSVKFSSVRTGAPDRNRTARPPRTPETLRLLLKGRKKYKKPGVSEHSAYIDTMEEWWPQSVRYESPSKKVVTLLPEDQRPTEWEFRHAAKSQRATLSPERVDRGEIAFENTHWVRRGLSTDGLVAVGQVGVLDATSEDYNPVSLASPLLVLPTSWRTIVVDGLFGYIFGVYRGFEHGGTIPGLMAILHAAEEKAPWARPFGFELADDQWLSICFKRVRGDNGDLKSELGFATLGASEVSLEITRSYTPRLKSVETKHKTLHRLADHSDPGSNRGRKRPPGGLHPISHTNFVDGWPPVIRAILHHNNEVPTPHLLTAAMRRAGVKPFRKEIVLWCKKEGFFSEDLDLTPMRAACLPALSAKASVNEIEVWDPRQIIGRRKIPQMLYWGEWMASDAWRTMARRGDPCVVQMNPAKVSEAFINFDGLKALCLLHVDPERQSLTLADWLAITDDDALTLFLGRGIVQNAEASMRSANRDQHERSKARRESAEAKHGGHFAVNPTKNQKRRNLDDEKSLLTLNRLGLQLPAGSAAPPPAEPSVWPPVDALHTNEDDTFDPQMEALRRRLNTL